MVGCSKDGRARTSGSNSRPVPSMPGSNSRRMCSSAGRHAAREGRRYKKTTARPTAGGTMMDPNAMQTAAERDQLWASLRALLPEIEKIAQGQFDGSERQRQIATLIARITVAELRFRAAQAEPD